MECQLANTITSRRKIIDKSETLAPELFSDRISIRNGPMRAISGRNSVVIDFTSNADNTDRRPVVCAFELSQEVFNSLEETTQLLRIVLLKILHHNTRACRHIETLEQ
jgi:hypothetical protein